VRPLWRRLDAVLSVTVTVALAERFGTPQVITPTSPLPRDQTHPLKVTAPHKNLLVLVSCDNFL